MTKKRIYIIALKKAEVGDQPRLIRAVSKARALAHVASEFTAALASQEDLAAWVPIAGVEDAADKDTQA